MDTAQHRKNIAKLSAQLILDEKENADFEYVVIDLIRRAYLQGLNNSECSSCQKHAMLIYKQMSNVRELANDVNAILAKS